MRRQEPPAQNSPSRPRCTGAVPMSSGTCIASVPCGELGGALSRGWVAWNGGRRVRPGVAFWDRHAAAGPGPGVGRSVRCQSGTPGTGARLPRGVPHREKLVQVRIELTDHLEQPFTLRPVG
jgi:hypothetical protein